MLENFYHATSAMSKKNYHMAENSTPPLSAAQIRAARSLLDWSGEQLAQVSGVSLQTIWRMESAVGPSRSSAVNVNAVRRALEDAGVVFWGPDEAGGPGVRLKT
jgi:DNA-binding XRE family transcriptional regulator